MSGLAGPIGPVGTATCALPSRRPSRHDTVFVLAERGAFYRLIIDTSRQNHISRITLDDGSRATAGRKRRKFHLSPPIGLVGESIGVASSPYCETPVLPPIMSTHYNLESTSQHGDFNIQASEK